MIPRHYRHLACGAALAAIAGLAAPAHAADINLGGMKDMPDLPEVQRNWQGFYFGGHIGYAGGSFNPSDVDPALDVLIDEELEHNPAGGILGVQAGYNLQRAHWVFGVEADISASSVDGHLSYDFDIGTPIDTFSDNQTMDLKALGTVRGRIGYDIGPAILYATAGWGFAKVDATFTATLAGPGIGPDGTISGSDSTTHNGWVVGGGAEAWLRDNVSLKLEYLYMDLGEEVFTPVPGIPGEPFDLDLHIIRAGINVHF